VATYIHDASAQDIANRQDNARRNQLLWFAGAIGATVGVAVLAYSRREVSYWERTKRTASQVAESATDIDPRLGIAAGTAVLGSAAALAAYRLRRPKSPWQKASQRADELYSQSVEQLRPWLGVIASVGLSAASAIYSAKSRSRMGDKAANAADQFADAASRIWGRLQKISAETGKLYPRARKLIA
jgi:hypothetical protein